MTPPAAAGFAFGAAEPGALTLGASAPPESSLKAPAATSMFDFGAPAGAAPAGAAEERGKPQLRQNFAPAPALVPQFPHLDIG